MIKTAVVLRC